MISTPASVPTRPPGGAAPPFRSARKLRVVEHKLGTSRPAVGRMEPSRPGSRGTSRSSAKSDSVRGASSTAGRGSPGPDTSFMAPFRTSVQKSLKSAKKSGAKAFNSGKFDESVRWFSQALALTTSAPDPEPLANDQVSLLLNRAAAWSRLGEHRNAVQDAERALRLEPGSPRALMKKGKALLQLQQFADASHTFIAGLDANPANEELRRGFYDSLRGLRLGWHQYCPSFSHYGSGRHSAPQSDGGPVSRASTAASGVRGADGKPAAMSLGQGAGFINVKGAREDEEVLAALQGVGAVMNLDSLLADEGEAYRAMKVNLDTGNERTGLVGTVLEYQNLLLQLFSKYCKLEWNARGGQQQRRGARAAAATGDSLTGDSGPAQQPSSSHRAMQEQQFWQFCVDCGLVTRTFNRRAVQRVWQLALDGVTATSGEPGAAWNSPASSFREVSVATVTPLFSPLPPPGRGVRRGSYGFGVAGTMLGAFPESFVAAGPPTPRSAALFAASKTRYAAALQSPQVRRRAAAAAAAAAEGKPRPSTTSAATSAGRRGKPAPTRALPPALFPKFVEGLLRLAAARYKPKPPPSRGVRVTVIGARRGAGADEDGSARGKLTALSSGGGSQRPTRRTKTDEEHVVPGLARRVKYALETHLLSSNLLHTVGSEPTADATRAPGADEEWADVQRMMDCFRSRLRKTFFYFATGEGGSHRFMDIREFLYMLKSLGVVDSHNLTLQQAARVTVTATGFIGDPDRHKFDFVTFCTALARCADVKTYDGVMPAADRLENFLVSDFFQKIRAKTDIANLWR